MDVFSFIKLVCRKTFNQRFKSPQEKIKKIKLQINEHEMFLQQALVLVRLHLS